MVIKKATETTPYIYYLVSKEGHIYIGSRTARGCHPSELWVKYFTTSNYVASLISERGEDFFQVEYIEVFADKDDAYWAEQTAIQNVWGTTGLLNKHYQKEGGAVYNTHGQYGEKNPMFGRTGESHPGWGKPGAMKGVTGEAHPMFGRKYPGNNAGEKNYWFGKSSPMKGCLPWDNPSAIKYGTRDCWLEADTAYEYWLAGNGYYKISKKLNIPAQPVHNMTNKFKDGWVPYDDPAWMEFKIGE